MPLLAARSLVFDSEKNIHSHNMSSSPPSTKHPDSSHHSDPSGSQASSSTADVTRFSSEGTPSNSSLHLSSKVTSPFGNHTGNENHSTGTTGAHVTSAHEDDPSSAGTTVAILITVAVVVAFVAVVLYYLKKKGKIPYLSGFHPLRSRRSSTTDSTRVLPQSDHTEEHHDSKHHRDRDDLTFTIEDAEEHGGRDEYFYDEVFGQSEFEDERIQSSVRELYSVADDNPEDDEMLDFDFETLGIKIEDYKIGDGRTASF